MMTKMNFCWLAVLNLLGLMSCVNAQNRVVGAGASFPARLYEAAIFAYSFVDSSTVISYESLGSSSGQCRIKDFATTCEPSDNDPPSEVDFAGSDALLDDVDYLNFTDIQMYPAVAGAVVPVYNLPELDAIPHTLVLSREVISQVFRPCPQLPVAPPCLPGSDLARWDDPRIVLLNNQTGNATKAALIVAALQDAGEIEVVVRSDGSGTTEIFKTALSKFDAPDNYFLNQIGLDSRNDDYDLVANVTKVENNAGVVGFVLTNPGTIGYSVLGEAIAVGVKFASIRKVEGSQPVAATSDSVANALIEKGLDFGSDEIAERLTVDISNALGSQAWPIVGYTYFITRKNGSQRSDASCADNLAMQNFFLWFYEDSVARQFAVNLGFAPLPDTVRNLVTSRIKADLKCEGSLVFQPEPLEDTQASFFGPQSLKSIMEQFSSVFTLATLGQATFEEYRIVGSRDAAEAALDKGVAFVVGSNQDALNLISANADKVVRVPFAGVGFGLLMNFCPANPDQIDLSVCDGTKTFGGLNMSPSVVEGVLTGTITMWDATEIAALNLGRTLPNEPIRLIHVEESDELEERFLDQVKAESGSDFSILRSGPFATTEATLDAQKSAIFTTPYSIGYVPTIGEKPGDTVFVRIRNAETNDNLAPDDDDALESCFRESTFDATDVAGPRFQENKLAQVNCYPFKDTIDVVVRMKYAGASCNPEASQNFGYLDVTFVGFLFGIEVGVEDVDEADIQAQSPLQAENLIPLGELSFAEGPIRSALESITCDGASILTPAKNSNLIPIGVLAGALTLMAICAGFCIAMIIWVQQNKTQRLLLVASPPFLLQILFGGLVALSAIVPLSFQDDGKLSGVATLAIGGSSEMLNVTCMVAPTLFAAGFAIIYSSLWLKTWRQIRIFNDERLKLQYITNNRLRFYQICLFAALGGLFLHWWLDDPLVFVRKPTNTEQDPILNTIGSCESDRSFKRAAPIIAVLGLALLYGLYLSYKSRKIPSDLNEGVFIGIAMIAAFEVLAIAIPVFFSTSQDPTVTYILQVFIILVTSAGTILLLFVPKLLSRYSAGWKVGGEGDSHASDYEMSDDDAGEDDLLDKSGKVVLRNTASASDPFASFRNSTSIEEDPFGSY